MRNQLDAEMQGGPSRRDSPIRRFGIPVVAAAAVVAAAIGAYALLGGNDGNGIAPAATATKTPTPTATTPTPTPPPTPTPTTPTPTKEETKQTEAMANPGQAYRKCIRLVQDAGFENPVTGLSGKLAIDNGKGITVLVANRTDAYTCNVQPDEAVSNPRPLDSTVSEETFAVANNATSNRLPDDPGDMTWGAGALPDGVTSITYTFPDGHQEPAITRNGFWVMQYFSEKPFFDPGPPESPIKVTLDGPGGERELTLVWGDHTCNQVSHGC